MIALLLSYNQSSVFQQNVLQGWLETELEVLVEVRETVVGLVSGSAL